MAIKQRSLQIDALRGLAIIGVMVVHSLAMFLGTSIVNATWNYLEFVVITFVACSGYVTWLSFESRGKKVSLLPWYAKRFFRLYYPYALYIIGYALFAYAVPGLIQGRLISLSPTFFISSATLTGGADVGWLVVLFLELTIVTPFFLWLMNNDKRSYIAAAIVGLLACFMVFIPIPSTYSRMVAWVPWSFVYLIGMIYAKSKKENILLIGTAGAILIWLLLKIFLTSSGVQLTFTLHKYPPDLYYLSYGLAATGILLLVVRGMEKILRKAGSAITFISKTSYGLFFLQLIVLDFLVTTFKGITVWPTMTLSIVLTITLVWLFHHLFDRV